MEPLRQTAIFLGMIQGSTYAALSLICVVVHHIGFDNLPSESHMDIVAQHIYTLFLGPNGSVFTNQSLTPQVFAGFVWVHLIFSLSWFGLSLAFLHRSNLSLFWSGLTYLICLWDLLTVIILGADYQKCLNWVDDYFTIIAERILNQGNCANGILPVLVIASKGFVLWIINVTVASVLLKKQLRKRVDEQISTAPTETVTDFRTQHAPVQNGRELRRKQRPTPFTFVTAPPPQKFPVLIPEPDYE